MPIRTCQEVEVKMLKLSERLYSLRKERSLTQEDVAKELERVYNCQITFASGQEFDNLITGEHDNKSLESVLKSIEFISDINYKKEGRNILLYKK